jgi:hypothetical protein
LGGGRTGGTHPDNEVSVTTETNHFLDRVGEFNDFNAVRMSGSSAPLSLVHPFWTKDQINRAFPLRGEWDVPEHLIPFCGDWHTLFCVDESTPNPTVVMLNDSRFVVHRWESLSVFSESLLNVPEEFVEDLGIIESESWLKF